MALSDRINALAQRIAQEIKTKASSNHTHSPASLGTVPGTEVSGLPFCADILSNTYAGNQLPKDKPIQIISGVDPSEYASVGLTRTFADPSSGFLQQLTFLAYGPGLAQDAGWLAAVMRHQYGPGENDFKVLRLISDIEAQQYARGSGNLSNPDAWWWRFPSGLVVQSCKLPHQSGEDGYVPFPVRFGTTCLFAIPSDGKMTYRNSDEGIEEEFRITYAINNTAAQGVWLSTSMHSDWYDPQTRHQNSDIWSGTPSGRYPQILAIGY